MFWLVASVEWYWKVVWPGTFAGWTDFIQYLVLLALWDDDGVRFSYRQADQYGDREFEPDS